MATTVKPSSPDVHHQHHDNPQHQVHHHRQQPLILLSIRPAEPPPVDAAFSSLMAASMVEMSAMLDTGPNPVPASPQQQAKAFVPPARPSSTPFPHAEKPNGQVCCLEESDVDSDPSHTDCSSLPYDNDDDVGHHHHVDDNIKAKPDTALIPSPAVHFNELPMEVHETIVDHLFGFRIAPTCSRAMRISSLTKSWSSALRHSRRRELAELALVNKKWTYLIQQRLYRHIKLKAIIDFVEDAVIHLACRPHLARHVKHVELWFPVFQPMYGTHCGSNTLTLPTITTTGLTNAAYVLPDNNCTLEDVFRFVNFVLPEAQVLTLEGGERRKAPKVVHSIDGEPLCPLSSVRTLVTRGQWNLMRDHADFADVLRALPNLEEWQGSYSKPKSKSYISLSHYLPCLPYHVTRLSMCMENDYRREAITPSFYRKVTSKVHVCNSLGQLLPRLEHFSFTGRACHQLFDLASRLSDPLTSRLSSVDLTIKNCCPSPDSNFTGSGSGIHEMAFIEAFEKLVLSAIRFLERNKRLQYLRIRFVDLDSLLPPLNPYFLLKDRQCTGVWSEAIVAEMTRVRPDASFDDLSESFGNIVYSKEGRMVVSPENPRSRISSLKLSNYQALANRMTIQ
ncbi:F-box-like domain-containing protein [Ophiocordyceps camponoti-floridani]|uniref:F-box-like domain-containing protein n=1 Tax=Ophiocordyceps camponoti-floridani TaxID=2030778 RepID=A0A8H4VF84_9HYPO|nr:F-box-like domain-containing protein [Ophiocordyceps camponoti-floridani]